MGRKNKTPDEFAKVKRLIASIQKRLAGGQYIYRGTPEEYKWSRYKRQDKRDISSSIFREYRENPKPDACPSCGRALGKNPISDGSASGGIEFDKSRRPVDFERDIILKAKSRFPDAATNREILTDIRHFGGLTTLIDFSYDLMVALFFACQEKRDRDGQLIVLLKKNIEISDHSYLSGEYHKDDNARQLEDMIKKSQDFTNLGRKKDLPEEISLIEPAKTSSSSARVIAQKSVFIHAPKGFIDPRLCKFITIKGELKADILKYLRHFHDINETTIYHDLHGSIAAEHRLIPALKALEEGNKYLIGGQFDEAIDKYNDAIDLKPDFDEAYVALARAEMARGIANA